MTQRRKSAAKYLKPTPQRVEKSVRAFLVTDSLSQNDGTTLWRLQYIPRATAAAMNADHLTRRNILARREQPMYGHERPGEEDQDYGPDDAMAEAAAARWQ